jgi:hypothetical protein
MSDENDKRQHSTRLHQKEKKIKRQVQLAKNYSYHKLGSTMNDWKYLTQPHRNHKTAIFNCGDPKCSMCMNPRKSTGEESMQERKHKQDKLYRDDGKED